MRVSRIRLAVFSLCFLFQPLTAEEPTQEPESDLTQMRLLFDNLVRDLQFQGGEDQASSFEKRARPVLNWSNPERKTTAGAMFVWTLDQRPQVAACVFPREGDEPVLELLSLSDAPFVMSTQSSSAAWMPEEPGVAASSFEPTRIAAGSPAKRLREMRLISREFEARVLRGKMPSIGLRLLPTPVYRYQPKSNMDEGAVVDGALFCFVQGTDPEVILMLEAIRGSEQRLLWRYSLGRMSRFKLEVKHKGKVIKSFAWSPLESTRTYYVIK